MKFSIIIPTFNRCHLLWKTLLSLKSQTFSDFEVLVIDDGSTDKTKELVSEFLVDKRFKYVTKENGGASSARNRGLDLASGDLITYIDSDEEVFPNYLEVIAEFLDQDQTAKFGVSNYNRVLEQYDNSLQRVKRTSHSSSQKDTIIFDDILNWKVKTCGTGIFHRSGIDVRWDDSIKLLEDLDFLISFGKKYPNGFIHIPYALFEYRQRYNTDGQCSLSNFGDFSNAFKAIYDKHCIDLKLSEEAYLGRFEKYRQLQKKYDDGDVPSMKDYIFP